MSNFRNVVRRGLVGTAVAVAFAGQALAGGVGAHKITCKAVGRDYFDGTTTATISSGTLKGTVAGTYTRSPKLTGIDSLDGTVTFSPSGGGTVTLATSGIFNLTTGEFSTSGTVIGGTGKFAAATGSLVIWGTEKLTTGAFSEDISGTLYY